jgi:hypothetical protein
MPAPVPEVLAAWMRPFRGYVTTAIWRHALVLEHFLASRARGASLRA